MDFGALEVQIFVSLALVLGAVFVALVCDFLKGNNEILRERNIELTVRQEERERRQNAGGPVTAKAGLRPASRPQPAPARRKAPNREHQEGEPPAQSPAWASREELDHVGRLADRIRGQVVRKPEEKDRGPTDDSGPAPLARHEPSKQHEGPPPPTPVGALALAVPAPEVEHCYPSLSAKVTPIDTIALERSAASEALQLAEELARIANMSSPEIPEDAQAISDEETGNRDSQPETQKQEWDKEPALAFSVTGPAANAENDEESPQLEPNSKLSLPTGMQNSAAFSSLLGSTEPFRGIVVAIGVGGLAGTLETMRTETAAETLRSLTRLIESLLTPRDLACRSNEEEFILVFPDEHGAAGQRRLQYVSQQLWDYQIRSVGTSSIMFCWGAVEAESEPLADAVASAKERMYQTKRNRERAPRQIHHYRSRIASNR